jgi:exopolysaccharide biosynthesis polyprenyl glycosylphosphotransferase
VKRLCDIVFSAALLIVLSPLLLIIALLVKVTSKGPVFFKQERIGRGGVPFKIWKFRSMSNDAEDKLADVLKAEKGEDVGIMYKIKDDPRVTPLGKFLRKTSIDELPQFFNVLGGSMSVVGPRPQIAKEVSQYDSEYIRRLKIKPGVTGPWQVSGRNALSFDKSKSLDLDYVENWSIYGDLVICAKTVREVFHPSAGAV